VTLGRLAGIARHQRKFGPVETLPSVAVSLITGVAGDHASNVATHKPSRRRQVSMIELDGWNAALAEIGATLAWEHSRRNFLIDGVRLPREIGTRLQIGANLVIEITDQCTPCHRMDALLPGLFEAMRPDWRGGFVARIESDGEVALGDEIRIL
jgi:MOSC domain-containing protein YiiM